MLVEAESIRVEHKQSGGTKGLVKVHMLLLHFSKVHVPTVGTRTAGVGMQVWHEEAESNR